MSAAPPLKTLLVVEDDNETRHALCLLAKLRGYEVKAVSTVTCALRHLLGQSKMILDLRLPDGNGVEVLKVLRQSGQPTDVAVITAEVTGPKLQEALEFEPELYLSKPIDVDRFIEWLGPVQ